MQGQTKTEYVYTSYLELYEIFIAPKLREIDLLVKTSEDSISQDDAAQALHITVDEVNELMRRLHLEHLDNKNFFSLMQHGSSNICRLYQRELACQSPYIYTRSDIAYIYQLEPSIVNKACDELRLNKITAYSLPMLLSHIPVYMPVKPHGA